MREVHGLIADDDTGWEAKVFDQKAARLRQ